MAPIVDCTTFGEKASTQSCEATMVSTPIQSHVRIIVPRFPGS